MADVHEDPRVTIAVTRSVRQVDEARASAKMGSLINSILRRTYQEYGPCSVLILDSMVYILSVIL